MQNHLIKTNRFSKVLIGFVSLGMLGIVLITIRIGFYLEIFSHEVAIENPEVAYMRVPVLIISEIIVGLFLIACILSFGVLLNYWKDRIFSKSSVIYLRIMSLCFALIIIPCVVLIIYTMQNVAGSITNLWVMFGIVISFVAACIFTLISNIVEQGLKYKEENELTI
ncbi:MAG: DUF2975 domain-containing protein [Clostridiaceae bacterium]|nr:DUF2975 domain-containing protein [Clostridiaceae bacterium]